MEKECKNPTDRSDLIAAGRKMFQKKKGSSSNRRRIKKSNKNEECEEAYSVTRPSVTDESIQNPNIEAEVKSMQFLIPNLLDDSGYSGSDITNDCSFSPSEPIESTPFESHCNIDGCSDKSNRSSTAVGESLPTASEDVVFTERVIQPEPVYAHSSADSNTFPITALESSEIGKAQVTEVDPLMLEKSPVRYFMEEMSIGNSLRNTTTIGNENDREGVYDAIFRLPWRCELLIDVGFLLCLDSFLSLLTIMPTRIFLLFWKLVNIRIRLFKGLSAAELCDFGCFVVLAFGISILELTDISLIYHMIRGQGTIKLYVVYNVLEIFDKLLQSFVGDVLQTLFNSAHGFANSSSADKMFWLWRFISDQTLAIFVTIAHSFILLVQAITLSTCIVAHSNALLALLVSNNFAEIKTNVFKRFSQDNIQCIVYSDSIERFHISAFLLFVLAQNILEGEYHWFRNFFHNALLVCVCEMAVDMVKHSFLAKFNNIKPIVYSEFLEDLCRQTLDNQNREGGRKLTFVPLAPASVVIRVLTPIYNAHLPYRPLYWRLFSMCILLVVTCVILGSLKVIVGMILRKHAIWYVKRCELRKHHLHLD